MAQVAPRAGWRARVDDYLTYLLREWSAIPALADEWDEWDEHSKLVFDLNWAVPEDRLLQLQRWSRQSLLTPAQRARYRELLKLVEQHRPTLDRLLAR